MTHFFNSSVLQQATYDENTHVMLLTFRGNRMYAYRDVALDVWISFIRSESAGQFFTDNIRRNSTITCTRIL